MATTSRRPARGVAPGSQLPGGPAPEDESLTLLGDGTPTSQAVVVASMAAPLAAMNVSPFLFKTYNLVSDPSTDAILSWKADGKSFIVHHPERMARELLPSTFKHANFASFVRQLNNYGFRKMQQDTMEFGAANFERGKPELLKHLRRNDASRHQKKAKQRVETEAAAAATAATAAPSAGEQLGVGGGVAVTYSSEIDDLKRDRVLLMREVYMLREKQILMQNEIQMLTQRFEKSDQVQQNLMSLLHANLPPAAAQQMELQGRKRKRLAIDAPRANGTAAMPSVSGTPGSLSLRELAPDDVAELMDAPSTVHMPQYTVPNPVPDNILSIDGTSTTSAAQLAALTAAVAPVQAPAPVPPAPPSQLVSAAVPLPMPPLITSMPMIDVQAQSSSNNLAGTPSSAVLESDDLQSLLREIGASPTGSEASRRLLRQAQ